MAPPEIEDGPAHPTPAVPADPAQQASSAPTPTPPRDESAKPVSDPDPDPGIEEGRHEYRPGGFHPVYIGDVYAEKYKILNKIGYGVYSTVWLVQDLTKPDGHEHKYLALKVLSGECYYNDKPVFEREILRHLRDGDRSQPGYQYICHLVDDFEHQGPNGKHVCLVFELMGENLSTFGPWFKEHQIPYPIMRRFAFQLVTALGYAHKHGVIHTDIKPDNILIKPQSRSLIDHPEHGYLARVPIPDQNRSEARYTPLKSRPLRYYYFGAASDYPDFLHLELALGDWGVASWTTRHLSDRIQPVALRAPEVLVGAAWDEQVDWWNLGALFLELYCAMRMFDGRVGPHGYYLLKKHLAEIVEVFGPFPKELLDRGNPDVVRDLFGEDGKVKDCPAMHGLPLGSEEYMPGLPDQEARDMFEGFLRTMMKINPAERPTAEELVKHPWIGTVSGDSS